MEDLRIDYEFTLEDFKEIERIEHSYFPNEYISKAEEVQRWYQKNNLTCIGIRNKEGKVIGSVNILPLKEDVFLDIYQCRMNEAEIQTNQIEKYEDGNSYYLYLSSISVDINYLNNYSIAIQLLKGCIYLLNILENKNISIKRIMAEASTIHGEKICKKLLHMDYINTTSHNSKVYCIDGKNLKKYINRIKQHIEKE